MTGAPPPGPDAPRGQTRPAAMRPDPTQSDAIRPDAIRPDPTRPDPTRPGAAPGAASGNAAPRDPASPNAVVSGGAIQDAAIREGAIRGGGAPSRAATGAQADARAESPAGTGTATAPEPAAATGTAPQALVPLAAYLADRRGLPAKGPVAVILIEDEAAVLATLRHHLARGFAHVLALSDRARPLPPEMGGRVTQLGYDTRRPAAHVEAVNALIAALPPGTWMYYGFNAEFLFHPFCEARSVGEMLAFHAEERREAMLSYVIDLYAGDLARHPDAVDLEAPLLDAKGYYALGRRGPDGTLHERQLDFHGGLRWRYEELLPVDRRRIDRIALFRTVPGLRVGADHRFNVEEYNTYSCPWHHNLTAVVASFRVAKALVSNPGSRDEVRDLRWRNSVPFGWSSQQLMDLGLMEPGQWF